MRVGDNITQPDGQSSARWQVLGRVSFGAQTVRKQLITNSRLRCATMCWNQKRAIARPHSFHGA